MIVYGDHKELITGADLLARIESRLAGAFEEDDLTAATILAGQLQQGVMDHELKRLGFDEITALGVAATSLTLAIARQDPRWICLAEELHALLPECELEIRLPEGYAFYAVFPQAYRDAAEQMAGRIGAVIGLRSIGASLAAMVALGAGTENVFSLRPVGPPFNRQVMIGDIMARALIAAQGYIAIVDEGPGLSGSSFGAVADRLEGIGIQRTRMIFFPSHAGDPGPQASRPHQSQWREARKIVPVFDLDLADLLGRQPNTVEDLSGGAWTKLTNDVWPTHTSRERLKYRVTTSEGAFLIKFAGLGEIGTTKLAMARELHVSGFIAEPITLRRGFLVSRWVDASQDISAIGRVELVDRLGAYIAFRADRFLGQTQSGGELHTLVEMARVNLREANCLCGLDRLNDFDATALSRRVRRVRIDGRMHPWEWVLSPTGALIKTDALDHHQSHDLIGCQDPAWDLAGAAIEFELDPDETDRLLAAYGAPVDGDLLALYCLLYLGFQIGEWTMALDGASPANRRAIAQLLAKYRRTH